MLSEDDIQRAVFEHLAVRRAPGVYAFHRQMAAIAARLKQHA